MTSDTRLPISDGSAGDGAGKRRGGLRLAVQVAGFLAGLALLAWCVRLAASDANREQLRELVKADWRLVAALIALSMVTVSISAEVFRNALRPVRVLPVAGMHATNAIASMLAIMPFKLSIVFRVLVHARRDRVPLLTIGAWFAAVSLMMAAVVGPVVLVSMARHTPDGVWAALIAGLIVLGATGLLAVARFALSARGWAMVGRLYAVMPKPARLSAESPGGAAVLERLREGATMLSSPRAVATCIGLRSFDMLVQAARVLIAAEILGHTIPVNDAVLAGGMFFLIGAVAPAGQLGAREAGTAGVLSAALQGIKFDDFVPVVLVISAAETLVLLAGTVLGIAYLRPDRLLRMARPAKP